MSRPTEIAIPFFLALLVAGPLQLPGPAGAVPQEDRPPREPEAVAILELADAALAEAAVLEFDFEMTGTHARAGRTTGHAVVERADGFTGLRYRAALTNHVKPMLLRRLGSDLEVAGDGETLWLLDHDSRVLQVGSAKGGAGSLQLPVNQFLMPLMYRPLRPVEIEQPERISLAGRADVGGVACDVVYLDFPDDSGFGEQYFYVGREDRLPRRIVLAATGNGALAQFDFVMTDLRVIEARPEAFRLAAPAGYTVDEDALEVAPGAVAEGWEMTTPDGETVRLEELRGKVVVLDFWASRCPFCRTQLPMVSDVAEEMAGLPVEFYGVNAWENGDPLAFLEEIGATIPTFLEGDDLVAGYRIASTAAIVIIGPEGRFQPRLFGNATREDLVEAIRAVLPETSAATETVSRRRPR